MGSTNDLTVFTYMRLIPDGNGYIRYVPYIETMSGQHSQTQAIRLKQLFYELECSAVVLDTQGKYIAHFMRNHRDLIEVLSKELYCNNRQLEPKLRFNSLNRHRA